MRALILSDIHSNLEALTAVLDDAQGYYDALWNLGDVVGYGGSPNQVLDLLRPLAALNVRGNHDRVCTGQTSALGFNPVARQAAEWTLKELKPGNLAWLKDVPQGPLQPITDVTCAHGSPLDEDHYIITMRDAWAPLQQMPTPITFFGHTHVQGGFSQHQQDWQEVRPRYHSRNDKEHWIMHLPPNTRHLINPGSVGQPRDNDWRAAYAIYDVEASRIVFHRIPYDVQASQGHILLAGLPERLAARLREGR